MTAWHELVVGAGDAALRAFIAGFLAGRGEIGTPVVFGSDLELEPESLGERLKELFVAGSHRVVIVPAPVAVPLVRALESRGRDADVLLERSRVIRAAGFAFRGEAFARPFAEELRAAIGACPDGVNIAGKNEQEEMHPEAPGVDLYAPVHRYIYRVSGRIEGAFPGVLEMYRRLKGIDWVEIGTLRLEG